MLDMEKLNNLLEDSYDERVADYLITDKAAKDTGDEADRADLGMLALLELVRNTRRIANSLEEISTAIWDGRA